MRVIARRRRQPSACLAVLLALVPLGLPAAGDPHAEIVDLIASMTAALSEDNANGFMKAFDKEMPGYGALQNQISALLVRAEISSSVEPLSDVGDAAKRSVDFDWYMDLKNRQPGADNERRRRIIHCEFSKQGKHWRIVSLQPLSFFSDQPPQ